MTWEKLFEEYFWPPFPRKVAKREARKAWMELQPAESKHWREDCNKILDRLEWFLQTQWTGREQRHLPHPATLRRDEIEDFKLAKVGTVFTFTLDHLEDGAYVSVPVPRLVLDLEGGGRLFLSMTDGDPEDVKIGMSAEVIFRRLHEASSFHNYYWKCRPLPETASS